MLYNLNPRCYSTRHQVLCFKSHLLQIRSHPMGKKKAMKKAGGNPDRVPRKEPYDAARMGKILERIREQAAKISGLARAIEDAKINSLVIDGHQMLFRGLNQI